MSLTTIDGTSVTRLEESSDQPALLSRDRGTEAKRLARLLDVGRGVLSELDLA